MNKSRKIFYLSDLIKGKLVKANGDIYEGEFKNNDFDGRGIEALKNGQKYEGEWKENIKNGKGINYIKKT